MSWAFASHGVVQDNPSVQHEFRNVQGDIMVEVVADDIEVDIANDAIEVEIEVS